MAISRRDFMHAGCAVAAATLVPKQADAFWHGMVTGSTGKSVLGIGDHFVPATFANLMKNAGSLSFGTASPADLNASLYPNDTASLTDNIGWVIFIAQSQVGAGVQYVMSWSGVGAVSLNFGVTVVSFTGTGSSVTVGDNPSGIDAAGTNARIVFTIDSWPGTGGGGAFFHGSKTFTGFGSLIFCRASDEAAVLANQYVILPEFKSLVQSLNPKIIRSMGWACNGGQDTLISKYAYRTPTTCLSYFMARFPLLVGSTAGSSDAYTCSPSSDMPGTTWTDGMTFQVKFDRANTTTTPTITPTGFAAKTMLRYNGGSDLTMPINGISVGEFATLIYDAVLDSVLVQNSGLTSGPPVEVRVAFCNALNKDYWHNFPYTYLDASVTSETAYVAANLNSQLNGYFELSNEMWNSALSNTSVLAPARGTAFGFSGSSNRNLYGGVGYRVRQVMSLVSAAWGGRSNLNRVIAWQTVDGVLGGSMDQFLLQGKDLASVANGGAGNALWISFTGNANYTAGGQRPIDFTEDLSYAPYYQGAQTNWTDSQYTTITAANFADLLSNAATYAGGGAGIATALAWLDNDIRKGTFPVKSISSVSGTTINATSNGFSNGQTVNFQVTGGSLPSPLVTNKIYFVVSAATNSFSVSLTSGGSAISLSGGSGTWTVGLSGSQTMLGLDVGPGGGNGSVYTTWQATAANYSKPVICYEGALEIAAPTTAVSGVSSTQSTQIANMINGYKLNALASTLALNQFQQFMGQDATSVNFGLLGQSKYPSWLSLADETIWALMQGDTFSSPYQTFSGVQTFNNT